MAHPGEEFRAGGATPTRTPHAGLAGEPGRAPGYSRTDEAGGSFASQGHPILHLSCGRELLRRRPSGTSPGSQIMVSPSRNVSSSQSSSSANTSAPRIDIKGKRRASSDSAGTPPIPPRFTGIAPDNEAGRGGPDALPTPDALKLDIGSRPHKDWSILGVSVRKMSTQYKDVLEKLGDVNRAGNLTLCRYAKLLVLRDSIRQYCDTDNVGHKAKMAILSTRVDAHIACIDAELANPVACLTRCLNDAMHAADIKAGTSELEEISKVVLRLTHDSEGAERIALQDLLKEIRQQRKSLLDARLFR